MENCIKFTLIVDKLNRKISEINIKISKDLNNEDLKNELDILLKDRDLLYKGSLNDVEKIIEKYGDAINE